MEHETEPRLVDRASREAFVRAHYAALYRWFCRLTGSPDRSADLTQETFVGFWGGLDRSPPQVSPKAWLYSIGRNLWRKQARDRREYRPAVLSEIPGPERTAEQAAMDREFQAAAELAVRELPGDLREAFTLRFWQNADYEEIGIIQGVSAGLARWRYFAAKRRLTSKLASWDPSLRPTREDQHAS